MSDITEIQNTILSLSEADYIRLRRWFSELGRENWNRRIEVGPNRTGRQSRGMTKEAVAKARVKSGLDDSAAINLAVEETRRQRAGR